MVDRPKSIGQAHRVFSQMEKEIERLTTEVSKYKQAAIDAETRLIDLTEELIRRGKDYGAIGWPQIRRMVEKASVSDRHSECEHGYFIDTQDCPKCDRVIDTAADGQCPHEAIDTALHICCQCGARVDDSRG